MRGSVKARAVVLQDLMSELKVLDKTSLNLGVIQLGKDVPTERTLEEEISRKPSEQIEDERVNNTQQEAVYNDDRMKEEEEKEPEKEDSLEKQEDEPLIW